MAWIINIPASLLDNEPAEAVVVGDNRVIFNLRLSNQYSVKRVFMMKWEIFEFVDMKKINRQNLQGILLMVHFNCNFQAALETELINLHFDLHFPDARRTEKNIVRFVQ